MNEFGFYSVDEISELSGSDLSFEIADTAILNHPDADDYMNLLIAELKKRGD